MQAGSSVARPPRISQMREVAPFAAILAVVAVADLPVKWIGERLAAQATSNLALPQAAVRYAAIVVTRLAEVIVVLIGLWLLFRLTRTDGFGQLGLGRKKVRWLAPSLALPLVALVIALVLSNLFGLLRIEQIQFPGPWPTLLALAASTHAAVIEEILFRSALLQGIERLWNRTAAILVTAALFTAMHLFAPFRLTPAWWFAVIVAGLGLGWAFYAGKRNLWAPIGTHLGFNFGVFMLFGLPCETRGALLWPGAPAAPALTTEAGWVLTLAAALTAVGAVLLLRHNRGDIV